MYRSPNKCMICGSQLAITEMTCGTCGTRLQGEFTGCPFCSLSPEESAFLLTFVKNRGSIKDVEREMGISYPTVRAALDNLIASLGLAPTAGTEVSHTEPDTRSRILKELSEGSISADQALERLNRLGE